MTGNRDVDSSMALLARARAGDGEALDRLCERLRPALRRWARGRLPRWARGVVDTEDLVQETLMHSVCRIEVFEPVHDGALQAYLRQALANRIKDEIRRHRRNLESVEIDPKIPVDSPTPLEEAVGSQNLERYEAALARLRPDDRELIVLRIEMDQSYDEIAAAIGKPTANATRMAVMRALIRLGEEIARER